MPVHQLSCDYCEQIPFLQAVINGEASDQNFRQMPTERINFLQFRIRFLEKFKLDVAVPGAQVQLIRAFQRHGIERYEGFRSGQPDSFEAEFPCHRATFYCTLRCAAWI